MNYRLLIAMCAFTASCASSYDDKIDYAQLPAGTVIAADSMQIKEDTLNDLWFSVKMLASEKTVKGVYDIQAAWGYNNAATSFTLPKGGEQFMPVLRREAAPYTYIIGFRMDEDTTFYPYYQVRAEQGTIKMQYVKSYIFE